jgi:hypothetical protein
MGFTLKVHLFFNVFVRCPTFGVLRLSFMRQVTRRTEKSRHGLAFSVILLSLFFGSHLLGTPPPEAPAAQEISKHAKRTSPWQVLLSFLISLAHFSQQQVRGILTVFFSLPT